MKKAEEKPAVEMTVGGKPKSGASHPPWKSLRDSHIPTARRLLYIFKTFARKEPSSAIASGYGFRLILRLEKTVLRQGVSTRFAHACNPFNLPGARNGTRSIHSRPPPMTNSRAMPWVSVMKPNI